VIVTSLPVALSAQFQIAPDRCGSCTRCIDACPTNALVAPREMDASRCIAYLTIEKKAQSPKISASRWAASASARLPASFRDASSCAVMRMLRRPRAGHPAQDWRSAEGRGRYQARLAAHRLAEIFGDCAFFLDGQVGDAARGVHLAGATSALVGQASMQRVQLPQRSGAI